MNFKKRVNGSWVDIPNYIHKTSTDKFATFPVDIHSTGTTATVGLKGNTVQSGTPTPDNPIIPQGTGERTGNLFLGDFSQFNNTGGTGNIYTYFYIPEDFTLTFIAKDTHTIPDNIFLGITKDGGQSTGGFTWAIPQRKNVTEGAIFTVGSSTREYHYVSMYRKSADVLNWVLEHYYVMLNLGSTPIPYEPYGYKIPISSAGQTTPIYLGEVETTRKIKKLVLTGEENFILKDKPDTASYLYVLRLYHKNTIGVCSHLPYTDSYPRTFPGFRTDASMQLMYMCIGSELQEAQPGGNTVEGFRYYLAAQYAAGTPVTIWYVLAEPETAVVNEPLMCIGNYADEVSNISIPVTAGGDTISVNTTVQPSEITVTWAGWHNTDIKEYYTDKTISDLEDMTISQMQTYTIASLQGGNWI